MNEPLKDQIDALRELQEHPGWRLYRDLVLQEITADFEEHITRALDVTDAALALDRMRQVAAVRKAGMRWLNLPREQLSKLQQQAQADQLAVSPGRRPVGV